MTSLFVKPPLCNSPSKAFCVDPLSGALIPIHHDPSGEESFYPTQQLNFPDNRKEVEDTKIYPYDCIGLVRSVISSGQDFIIYGTGYLIDDHCVLTAAHNLFKRNQESG